MDIEKEIENLRYQAQSDLRTGYPDLAEWRNQIADWLEELIDARKNKRTVVTCEKCEHAEKEYQLLNGLVFYRCKVTDVSSLVGCHYCSCAKREEG